MNVNTINLDVSKEPAQQPALYLGQGDANGTQLVCNMFDNGATLDLTGKSVTFWMRCPGSESYYSVAGTVSGNVATFTIDETYAAAYAGETDNAYVQVTSGSVVTSTSRIHVVVLESAREGVTPAPSYVSEVDAFIEQAEADIQAAIDAIDQTITDAIPTMTASIKGGAKLGSGLDVTDEVLSVEATTTAQIDAITGDTATSGDESLSTTGLNYFWSKLKAWANNAFAAISHNHAASDITSGTLSIARGGTNASTAAAARTNLGITPANIGAASISHEHAASDITSGTLPIARGGTNASTAAGALTNLGAAAASHTHAASDITSGTLDAARIPSLDASKITTGTLAIARGGTNAGTVAGARYNLMQGIAETTSAPSDAAHVLFSRGDGSADDVFYTRPWSSVYADLGFDSSGNLDFGGTLSVDGTSAYLLFTTSAIASFAPPTGVSTCMVLDTSDYGLYWYTA